MNAIMAEMIPVMIIVDQKESIGQARGNVQADRIMRVKPHRRARDQQGEETPTGQVAVKRDPKDFAVKTPHAGEG